MTNPLFLSADPSTKKLRESHVPPRLTDAALSAKIAASVGNVTPDGVITSADFSTIKITNDPMEEAPVGTLLFYMPLPETIFTNFSGLPIGEAPGGWTTRWATNRMWRIIEDATASNGVALECSSAAGTAGLQWDVIDRILDGATDGEIIWKWKTSNLVVPARAFTCGSGEPAAPTMFHGAMRNSSSFSLGKFVDGVHTSSVGTTKAVTDFSANTWYISRMRKSGTTLQARTWIATDTEPGSWEMEVTDSALSQSGWWGLLSHVAAGATATHTYDWVGFAAGDNTAPKGA
ncbi:MAG: hypothetical protein Q4F10_12315 [Corynebacterium glutamicum]|nr:hypothetical protein [Corynebacterium glutamicum]